MVFLNIVILLSIFLKRNSAVKMLHNCFESPGNPEVDVGIYFADSLSFVPDKVFLKYEMLGSTWDKKDTLVQYIDLERVEKNCEKHGIRLPKVDRNGENVAADIIIYSDDTQRVVIEHFKINVAHDFQWRSQRVEGLYDVAQIDVLFSPHIKELKFARSPSFKYSQISGRINVGEPLCLKLFKTGKRVVLEVMGPKLDNKDIYDRYFVEASLPNTDSGEVRKLFFAQGYNCKDNGVLGKLWILVNDFSDGQTPVPEVKLSITDYSGHQFWEIVLLANRDEYADTIQKGDVFIDPVKVIATKVEKAPQYPDGLMMYPFTYERYYCPEDSEQSFVEYRKFGSVIVETRSQLVSREYSTNRYYWMHSGTQDQIDKCLKKK